MENGALVRLHASVEGHVQGVGFRMFVKESAERLGLVGWVRNRWNGTVELTAEGPRHALDDLLRVLRRGPRSGRVTGVKPSWQAAEGEFAGFHIRRTA